MSYCSLEEAWGDSQFSQYMPESSAHGHQFSRDTETLPNHNGSQNRTQNPIQIAPLEVDEEYTGQFSNHEFSQVIQTTTSPTVPLSEESSDKFESPNISERSEGSGRMTNHGKSVKSHGVEPDAPWKEISDKLEKLIILLMQKHSQKAASWPDSIIYFLTGIFAILILWCFFSIGKWIGSKSRY